MALNLDKTLHVSKAICIPDVIKYFIHYLFFCLAIFISALEYFHQHFLSFFSFFFWLVLRLVVWRGVFGWFSVVLGFGVFFGYKGLEANLRSAAMGNTLLGTHWAVRNCLIDNIINDGSLKNLEENIKFGDQLYV